MFFWVCTFEIQREIQFFKVQSLGMASLSIRQNPTDCSKSDPEGGKCVEKDR
jgi:hypothetical protein